MDDHLGGVGSVVGHFGQAEGDDGCAGGDGVRDHAIIVPSRRAHATPDVPRGTFRRGSHSPAARGKPRWLKACGGLAPPVPFSGGLAEHGLEFGLHATGYLSAPRVGVRDEVAHDGVRAIPPVGLADGTEALHGFQVGNRAEVGILPVVTDFFRDGVQGPCCCGCSCHAFTIAKCRAHATALFVSPDADTG